MEISGTIFQVLPEQRGEGKIGPCRKQEFIVETPGQYPRKVCIQLWGDKIDEFSLKEGEVVKAYVNVESKEYNGRWFTNVKAWKIEKEGDSGAPPPSGDELPPFDEPLPPADENDDLPF